MATHQPYDSDTDRFRDHDFVHVDPYYSPVGDDSPVGTPKRSPELGGEAAGYLDDNRGGNADVYHDHAERSHLNSNESLVEHPGPIGKVQDLGR